MGFPLYMLLLLLPYVCDGPIYSGTTTRCLTYQPSSRGRKVTTGALFSAPTVFPVCGVFFFFFSGWGIQGAAIATVTAEWAGVMAFLVLLAQKEPSIRCVVVVCGGDDGGSSRFFVFFYRPRAKAWVVGAW